MESDKRSSKMKKNIFYSFLMRSVGIVINFLYVPLIIDFVNTERYGIWLTVSSIIGWMGLLDIGFGNGLRNKYAESIVNNDVDEQKKLIQTTLFVLILISFSISAVEILLHDKIYWDSILGVSLKYRSELQELFLCLILIFSLQFIFQIVNPIYYALQKSSLVSLSVLLGNIFGFLGVIVLKKYSNPSLLSLGLTVMLGNLLSSLILFINYSYKRRDLFKNILIPQWINVNSIFSLGIKFFIVNIAYVIQYQTINFLINRYYSSIIVTEFNVAFKLFSVGTVIFGVIISPVWSTVTNAYANNDFRWIKQLIKKLIFVWITICVGSFIVLYYSDNIYSLWLGNKVDVPFLTSFGALLIVCTSCFSSIFIHILNGVSKINLQFWLSILVIIIFFPLAYYISIVLKWGVFGICFAIVLVNINGILIAPIQLVLLLTKMQKNVKNVS